MRLTSIDLLAKFIDERLRIINCIYNWRRPYCMSIEKTSSIYRKRIAGKSTSISCRIEIELGTWRTGPCWNSNHYNGYKCLVLSILLCWLNRRRDTKFLWTSHTTELPWPVPLEMNDLESNDDEDVAEDGTFDGPLVEVNRSINDTIPSGN